MRPNVKPREYKTFPQSIDATPRTAHGRTDDKSHERITRPLDATPRRAKDWR